LLQQNKIEMNRDEFKKIREAGLKLTPQRKAVYGAMLQLHHATIDDIISLVQTKYKDVTVSTVYRILDSFCAAHVLSCIYHPESGKCYYDITVDEHHHLFNSSRITDYADADLSQLIREYLKTKDFPPEEIEKIQVQVTLKHNPDPDAGAEAKTGSADTPHAADNTARQ